jgi:Ribbon-helix-helix protein, copG family.
MRQRNSAFLVRFEDHILEKLKQVAKEEGRTVTELIREAVAELLRDRERKTLKKK